MSQSPHLQSRTVAELPSAPATIFLIGIGGIGMSGLAQLLCYLGYRVAGSDRDPDSLGRATLMGKLRGLGVELCSQDGDGLRRARPDAIIYSSAVETDNPDRTAGAETGVPEIPRAHALSAALGQVGGTQIAVAGSCGKTSVTGWITSALRELGQSVLMVCGGLVREFESDVLPGNFFSAENPTWLIYEVDESDRSLVAFIPDYGMVLNIGTDHHERSELIQLFSRFLENCRRGAVANADLADEIPPVGLEYQAWFADLSASRRTVKAITPTAYTSSAEGITVSISEFGDVPTRQFGPHSAANAAAVLALLNILPGLPDNASLPASLGAFRGVHQRFEVIGRAANGVWVYNDYAHNVEKIAAAVQTAQELELGPVKAVFQPHGYGPLGFMRDAFREALPEILRPEDELVLLPVYYAGGTTSFSPTSDEIAAEYAAAGLPVSAVPTRKAAAAEILGSAPTCGVVLVLGARDPSLPVWCHELLK